jgi:hypothetical protein
MPYWRPHFENEIPIKCLFTQWKWTWLLDFGHWRWSALNMGYILDKRPSRTQGQFYFLESDGAGNSFQSEFVNFGFVLWGLLGGTKSRDPSPLSTSLRKFVGGGISSGLNHNHLIMRSQNILSKTQDILTSSLSKYALESDDLDLCIRRQYRA